MSEAVAAFSEASGLMESTICNRAVGDARFLEALRSGNTFTIRRHDRLMGWLRENWPEGHDRPSSLDVSRHDASLLFDEGEDAAGAADCHVNVSASGLHGAGELAR